MATRRGRTGSADHGGRRPARVEGPLVDLGVGTPLSGIGLDAALVDLETLEVRAITVGGLRLFDRPAKSIIGNPVQDLLEPPERGRRSRRSKRCGLGPSTSIRRSARLCRASAQERHGFEPSSSVADAWRSPHG